MPYVASYVALCAVHIHWAALLVSEYLKAALDPKVKVRVEGVVLTSPAIGVQPSHPIVAVSMFLALEIKKSQTEVLDCIIL